MPNFLAVPFERPLEPTILRSPYPALSALQLIPAYSIAPANGGCLQMTMRPPPCVDVAGGSRSQIIGFARSGEFLPIR
jgi:hypothetical protein